MSKGPGKGRKGKGPARRHPSPVQSASEEDESLQPSTSHMSTESQEILNLHTEMVMEIRGIFSHKSEEWCSICFQVKEKKYLSPLDMGDVSNMLDLCGTLRRKGVISYGEYSKLREVLVTCDVDAGKIIDDYSERIRREREGNFYCLLYSMIQS
ncbi:uncharacterized protein LOC110446722 [Mizuhopecten yessoensis]|uniref:uncharacterized protein LOC110446722 n=1 Tax=Mizuhopecten yessoensis TaxID=6573 RepID=UPI000B459881|nr:uncharacterized protein LOC110446722 [Mizuhopecten yessoensis]